MEIIDYIVDCNLNLALFYGCYWLFFRKTTFFQWNRVYLLVSMILSMILPLVEFDREITYISPVVSDSISRIPVVTITPEVTDTMDPWLLAGLAVYASVLLFLLVRFFKSLILILRIARSSEQIECDGFKVILFENVPGVASNGSFSFFKQLFINQNDYAGDPFNILSHEMVHIRQWHSIDLLFAEVLKIIFWFNPILWFYKKSIETNHEFLADCSAENRDTYAQFLVNYAFAAPETTLTNRFFTDSILKSRIVMLYKNRTSRWHLAKYLMIVPLTLVGLFLTGAKNPLPEEVVLPEIVFTQTDVFTINGTIQDKSGKGIKGANVVIKNGTRGAAADKSGKFEMENVEAGTVLVASHIQYKAAEFTVKKGKQTYQITLEPEVARATKIGQNAQPGVKKPETMQVAESRAEFPGGFDAMNQFLTTNLKYPKPALDAKVEGSTILEFTVEESGEIRNIVIVKGIGFGADMESVRIVKSMPKWKPAIQNGVAVGSRYSIEIQFELPKKRATGMNYRLPDMDGSSLGLKQIEKRDVERITDPLGGGIYKSTTLKPTMLTRMSLVTKTDTSSYRYMNYQVAPIWRWARGQ